MAAGKNSKSSSTSSTYYNPIDPDLDPQGYALYELNNAPKGSLAIDKPTTPTGVVASDNPTFTGTTKKPKDGSVFQTIFGTISGGTKDIVDSFANLTYARKGIPNPNGTGLSTTDQDGGNQNTQPPLSNDGGNQNNNTVFYIIGGVLVLVIIFLVVSKSSKKK
jgi:hypothetical protein